MRVLYAEKLSCSDSYLSLKFLPLRGIGVRENATYDATWMCCHRIEVILRQFQRQRKEAEEMPGKLQDLFILAYCIHI